MTGRENSLWCWQLIVQAFEARQSLCVGRHGKSCSLYIGLVVTYIQCQNLNTAICSICVKVQICVAVEEVIERALGLAGVSSDSSSSVDVADCLPVYLQCHVITSFRAVDSLFHCLTDGSAVLLREPRSRRSAHSPSWLHTARRRPLEMDAQSVNVERIRRRHWNRLPRPALPRWGLGSPGCATAAHYAAIHCSPDCVVTRVGLARRPCRPGYFSPSGGADLDVVSSNCAARAEPPPSARSPAPPRTEITWPEITWRSSASSRRRTVRRLLARSTAEGETLSWLWVRTCPTPT